MDRSKFNHVNVSQDDYVDLVGVDQRVYVAHLGDDVAHLETVDGEVREYVVPRSWVPSGVVRPTQSPDSTE